jgi:hypothetical protein
LKCRTEKTKNSRKSSRRLLVKTLERDFSSLTSTLMQVRHSAKSFVMSTWCGSLNTPVTRFAEHCRTLLREVSSSRPSKACPLASTLYQWSVLKTSEGISLRAMLSFTICSQISSRKSIMSLKHSKPQSLETRQRPLSFSLQL